MAGAGDRRGIQDGTQGLDDTLRTLHFDLHRFIRPIIVSSLPLPFQAKRHLQSDDRFGLKPSKVIHGIPVDKIL